MRIATVHALGRDWPAAFSLRVLANLEDRLDKSATEALDELLRAGRVRDTAWLLSELIAAGMRITEQEGEPPSISALLDGVGMEELAGITAGVLASVRDITPRLELEEDGSKKKESAAGA